MSELELNGRRECCEHAKHKDEAEWIKRSTMMEAHGGNIHKYVLWDDDKQDTESFDSIMRTHMSGINTTTTMTILHALYKSAKNCRILLEQGFTACMPLLTAISAFRLQRRCYTSQIFLNSVTCTIF